MKRFLNNIMGNNAPGTEDDRGGQEAYSLFSLRGRISRRPYWMFILTVTAGAAVLGFFKGVTFNFTKINDAQIIYFLFMAWPSVAVLAKRWHDLSKSALWVLIILIPIIGPIWTLYETGFIPGVPGPNEFGPGPLDKSEEKGQT